MNTDAPTAAARPPELSHSAPDAPRDVPVSILEDLNGDAVATGVPGGAGLGRGELLLVAAAIGLVVLAATFWRHLPGVRADAAVSTARNATAAVVPSDVAAPMPPVAGLADRRAAVIIDSPPRPVPHALDMTAELPLGEAPRPLIGAATVHDVPVGVWLVPETTRREPLSAVAPPSRAAKAPPERRPAQQAPLDADVEIISALIGR